MYYFQVSKIRRLPKIAVLFLTKTICAVLLSCSDTETICAVLVSCSDTETICAVLLSCSDTEIIFSPAVLN
jgi:hypothetical protein